MPDTLVHHIKTEKTARYFTLGKLDAQTRHVWLVLHGYGQLAEYFIRNFKNVHHDQQFIIAPEALSRFYLNETAGRIGATWMTKEDREAEIEDYLHYLDQVIGAHSLPAGCKLHVFGFSQGAATASRWALHTPHAINTLVCWAGFFPPDMQWDSPKYLGNEMKTYLLYGVDDVYIDENLKKEIEKVMAGLQKKPNIITFEGKHEIVTPTLYTLFKSIENG